VNYAFLIINFIDVPVGTSQIVIIEAIAHDERIAHLHARILHIEPGDGDLIRLDGQDTYLHACAVPASP